MVEGRFVVPSIRTPSTSSTWPARVRRRGDDDVVLFHRLRQELDLLAVRFFRELLRVSAGALAGLAEVDLEEIRTERLNLLLHDRPRVEGLDDRAEPARG